MLYFSPEFETCRMPGVSMWEIFVDLVGFEPTTSSMPWKRAPNCATGPQLATALEYHAG
jgi:hypothetical protein